MDYSLKLKELRKANGLYARDVVALLRERYDIRISDSALFSWERGDCRVNLKALAALCEIYGTSADAFLDLDAEVSWLHPVLKLYYSLSENAQKAAVAVMEEMVKVGKE